MANEKRVIDWELGTKLAGNKREFAEEMLNLFVKTLSSEMAEMKKLKENKNYTELLKRTHKLHGASCYCGVPRLKDAAAALESALKHNKLADICNLFTKFETEVNQLMKEALPH